MNIEHPTSNTPSGGAQHPMPMAEEPPLTRVPDVLSADHYALQPHPLIPLPTAEEAAQFMNRPGGAEELTKLLNDRGQLIYLMESDPANYGAELPQWKDADEQLAQSQLLYVSGGKRASKSEWAAKRFVESCEKYGKSKRWAFQDNETTSKATQQQLFWRYMKPEYRALNGKKTADYKIKWSRDGGFTENMLVLPNATEVYFLTYNQVPEDFQGWELGARVYTHQYAPDGRRIENIGAWTDENLTVKWLETLKFRLSNRSGKLVWTYSTTEGITAAIKYFLGAAKTLQTRPADLLSHRINLPGLPLGHMPYIQQPITEEARVIYFFTQWNPFSGYEDKGGVKQLCQGKTPPYIMMNAYGYAEDTKGRAFPMFSEINIIDPKNLPEDRTNYHATDPAGARNWATIWAGVPPGDPQKPDLYIYRDWPDCKRYEEWARPSDNPRKLDGDRGPAQRSIGYGPTEYKNLFLEEERILFSPDDHDPYRLKLLERAKADGADPGILREVIKDRYIDPRAGRNQHAVDKGGVCLVDKLAEVNRDAKTGQIIAPGMNFITAPGLDIAEGVAQINGMLFWDKKQDLMPVLNYPRLFVSANCKQVIWALSNWTGHTDHDGGAREFSQDGACKDFVDLIRYLVTAGVRYVMPGGRVKTYGGGSY